MHVSIIKSDGYGWLSSYDIGLLTSEPDRKSIIHDGRNRLWTCRLRGEMFVVKHFRKSIKNMLVYTFAKTKACKSWRNATELLQRGISTPLPVACVERRSALGCLLDCWYICQFVPSQSLACAIEESGNEAIEGFATFVSGLHCKGVRHDDLNNTNVRVTKIDDKRFFSLIDLNRMKIYPEGVEVPMHECFRNVCCFCSLDHVFETFITAYLDKRHLPASQKAVALKVKKHHDIRYDLKKRIKKLVRP